MLTVVARGEGGSTSTAQIGPVPNLKIEYQNERSGANPFMQVTQAGNVYKITATVQTQLAWSTSGRLYSVETENGGHLLPVLIPAEFNAMNIQKGQRYYLQIKVEDKGILKAQGIRKV